MSDEWEEVKGKHPEYRPKSFVVHITSSHIARGHMGDIFNDAPALAIRDQIPNTKWAMVGWGYATTGDNEGTKRYWDVLEWAAFVAWMRSYDYGRNPPPAEFTFVLNNEMAQKPVSPIRRNRNFKSYAQLEAEKR